MAFENGGSGHFQSDIAVTKFVTVLIFAIFCPLGIARRPIKALQAAGSVPIANKYLVCG